MVLHSALFVQTDAAAVVFVLFESALLLVAVLTATAHSLVEIDLVGVELGAIYAGKLGLTTNANPASTTHTRTINHQRVKRCDGGNTELLGGERHKLHHNHKNNQSFILAFRRVQEQEKHMNLQ